jgi:RNase H-fold protein (predicted Holliday junction resolvase)
MKAMIAGGVKKSDRTEKGSEDKLIPAIILQTYLDRQQNNFF